MEILLEAGQPVPPGTLQNEILRRVQIGPELLAPNAHGQVRWWAQLSLCTGEAAVLGWIAKRNGWSITEDGIRVLKRYPEDELYRVLTRQYRARRRPVLEADAKPEAFEQFQLNLGYARQLVDGGRSLERLKVGSFDITDLYRAAWTQAVAALDHWVTREIINRGVALAQSPAVARPDKFNKMTISVELFEKIHHHDEPLAETFRDHLVQSFEFMTFQNPDKIKEGFGYVSKVNLWPKVAQILSSQDPNKPITPDEVRGQLREIARRRNNIAHTADHDQHVSGQKKPITAADAEQTIDLIESVVIAIILALGDPLPAEDYNSAPSEAGALGVAPESAVEETTDIVRRGTHWDEESVLRAIERYCSPQVARTLLAVYRHAERHPSFRGYYFGEAAYPSVTAWCDLESGDPAAVWSIFTGVKKSFLSINFEWIRNRKFPVDRLAKMAADLKVLPGWGHLPERLAKANYAKRPSLGPEALAHPAAADIIIAALNDILAKEKNN